MYTLPCFITTGLQRNLINTVKPLFVGRSVPSKWPRSQKGDCLLQAIGRLHLCTDVTSYRESCTPSLRRSKIDLTEHVTPLTNRAKTGLKGASRELRTVEDKNNTSTLPLESQSQSTMSSSPSVIQKDPDDLIARGSRRPTPLGRSLFFGLRAIDPFIQYAILSRHAGISWIPRLMGGALLPATGLSTIGLRPANAAFLDLPPYQTLLLGLSVGSMLKQNFWLVAIQNEEMPAFPAFLVSLYNTILNAANNTLALWTLSSINPSNPATFGELFKNPWVAAGTALYVTGILTETISEVQRSNFKKDERNKGKPYAGGLFGLARNVNYTGYTLWRTGYAVVAAGPVWGAVKASWFLYDFSQRAIPALERYCSKRVSCFFGGGVVGEKC